MKKLLMMGIIVFNLFLFLGGCGGTDTGNPTIPSDNDDDILETSPPSDGTGATPSFVPAIRVTEFLLDQLCEEFTECFQQIGLDVCKEGLILVTNIDQELGIEEGKYPSYEAIIEAEKAGVLIPDSSAAGICMADTTALSCNDPSVRAAYNTSDPSNFDFIADMIPDSCQKVFVSE